ncbi:MAG: UDP-N-acetylmuramate dehydrogenase [Ruminococcaceae bacterium]|nr:UDP-N-acetylmuramate dehydrogenase [Oscillospiraceae bacterium]
MTEKVTAFLNSLKKEGINSKTRENVSMKEHTTFKTGGECTLAIFPETAEELEKIVTLAKENSLPFYVVGKGSNLLVSDEGYWGLIIFTHRLDKITFNGDEVYAEAGVSLTALAKEAGQRGLHGLEFACGIPGSVGGAVYMNAGAYDGEMKDVVVSSDYYSPTFSFGTLTGEEQNFSYRSSAYMNSDKIILGCKIKLEYGNKDEILSRQKELMAKRREKQPLEFGSAGSTFKRYPGRYTGQMIEEAGLKGFGVGDACVSEKHAGFIINKGNATSKDVLEVIREVRKKVYEKEGIELVCEVRYLSPKGEEII